MAHLRGVAACVAVALFAGLPTWVAASVGAADFDWEGGAKAPLWTIAELDDRLREKKELGRACMVMFHVSWCKVCQRAFPEFIAAAEQVASAGIPVDFAHIDCEQSTCTGYVGRGYPTIKLYTAQADGENRTFKSQRSSAGFVKYAERMTLPAVRTGLSRATLAKALDNETQSAFVTAAPNGEAVLPSVLAVANRWMDQHIFASSSRLEELLPEGVSVPAKAAFAVLSSARQQWAGHDNSSVAKPEVVFFQGNLDNKDEVAEWVLKHRYPGIWKLDERNFFDFTHADRKTALLAVDPANCSMESEQAWRGAAAELTQKFIFGVIDSKSWNQELTDFNLHQEEMPRILVTEDNFDAWVEDVNDLRVVNALGDLRGLHDGSRQLLRQSRTTMSKLRFWYREFRRFIMRMTVYADQGPMQATLVVVGFISVMLTVFFVSWCLYQLVAYLFSEDDEPVPYVKKTN